MREWQWLRIRIPEQLSLRQIFALQLCFDFENSTENAEMAKCPYIIEALINSYILFQI